MKKNVVLSFLFASFLAGSLHALTLAELRSEIRRNVRDTSSSSDDQRYSSATLLSYINEAQADIVNLTWLSEKTTEYILTARTTYYTLPNDTLDVFNVKFSRPGQTQVELKGTSLGELMKNMPSWESVSGQPNVYYLSQSTTSSASSTSTLRIAYLPVATNTSTGTVTVRYFNQVDDLASDTDVPFNGKRNLYPYHMAITYHATMKLKALEGRAEEAAFYLSLYQRSMQIIHDRLGRLSGYSPSISVGTPSR